MFLKLISHHKHTKKIRIDTKILNSSLDTIQPTDIHTDRHEDQRNSTV